MCLWPSFKLLMFGLTKLLSVPRSPCPAFLGHLTNIPVFILAWRDVLCSGPDFPRQSRDSSTLDFLQLILGHISGFSTTWWKHERQCLNLLFNWMKWGYAVLSAFRFAFNSPHNLTTRALLLILQLPNSWFNADIIWKQGMVKKTVSNCNSWKAPSPKQEHNCSAGKWAEDRKFQGFPFTIYSM